jgi:hypothetical protein
MTRCWRLIAAVEHAERVPFDERRGRCGKADHASVEILDDFCKAIEDGSMGLIEDPSGDVADVDMR